MAKTATRQIPWQVSDDLYRQLTWATETFGYPSVESFVTQAVQRFLAEMHRQAWRKEFRALQRDIRADGGFGLGDTKEEVIASLRQLRQQIYEDEYADLY